MDFDGYCLENLRTAFAVSTCCNGRRAGARVPWGGVGAVCGSPAGAGSGGHGGQPELVTMPEGGEGLQAVLLRAAAPTRRTIAASVGEMPRHVGAAFDLIRRADPGPVVGVKGHVGEDVILGLVHGPGKAGEARSKAVGDLTPLPARRLLGEDGAARSGDQGPLPRSDLSEQVAQDMDPSPVPSGEAFGRASEITSCTPRGPRRVRRKIDRGPNPDRSV